MKQHLLNYLFCKKQYKTKQRHWTTKLVVQHNNKLSLTLLGDTNSLSTTSSGFGVLSTYSETPVMPQTTVVSV